MGLRFIAGKSHDEMVREWDSIAHLRDKQLAARRDVTFERVLRPWVASSVRGARTIIDVGCGTGRLTDELRDTGALVLGIDPSAESVAIARARTPHGHYEVASLEEWTAGNPGRNFELTVANMVLMDVADLKSFCQGLARVARGGRVLATLTHPAFWPIYWNYSSRSGFDYMAELTVEAPFRTSSGAYPRETTHVHRPISTYLTLFEGVGLRVVRFEELRGVEPIEEFPFPRFLALELQPREPAT